MFVGLDRYSQYDFGEADSDEDEETAREKEAVRKRLFRTAAKPPTLGMVLRRGAFRVHVQFGLQKLLKQAQQSLRLRRLDVAGDDVWAPTVGVVEGDDDEGIIQAAQLAPANPFSAAVMISNRARSSPPRKGMGGGASSSSSSSSSVLSDRDRAELVAEERQRMAEAKARAKKRRRLKKRKEEAASQYMPCCKPEKNADGTSSEVGMSIFAKYPDRCNICGKQLRRKPKTIRPPRNGLNSVGSGSGDGYRRYNDADAAADDDDERSHPDVQRRAMLPLPEIVRGPRKPPVKIRASKRGGRILAPDGSVPGFLRGTRAWDEEQAAQRSNGSNNDHHHHHHNNNLSLIHI